MDQLSKIADSLGHLPTDSLVLLVALGALALAAFAIHAIASIAKGGKED